MLFKKNRGAKTIFYSKKKKKKRVEKCVVDRWW
jgi:hypothetical protein